MYALVYTLFPLRGAFNLLLLATGTVGCVWRAPDAKEVRTFIYLEQLCVDWGMWARAICHTRVRTAIGRELEVWHLNFALILLLPIHWFAMHTSTTTLFFLLEGVFSCLSWCLKQSQFEAALKIVAKWKLECQDDVFPTIWLQLIYTFLYCIQCT